MSCMGLKARMAERGRTDGGELGHSPTKRLLLSREGAAHVLSMSVDSFDRHVRPQIRAIHCMRHPLFAVRELEQWIEASSGRVLPEDRW